MGFNRRHRGKKQNIFLKASLASAFDFCGSPLVTLILSFNQAMSFGAKLIVGGGSYKKSALSSIF